jgi:hypothetical protein
LLELEQAIDPLLHQRYLPTMTAVEFITELNGAPTLAIPQAAVAQLPKSGRARVIVLTDDSPADAEWRAAAYEQFLRDDPAEDAIYERLR